MRFKKLWFILLLLLICFIWGNSMMSASVSTDLSEWFRSIFNGVAGFFGSGETASSGRIRKTAHFVEFAVLGIIASLLIISGNRWKIIYSSEKRKDGAVGKSTYRKWRKRRFLIVLTALFGLIVACADEMIQLTSSGRSAQLSDVALDFSGYLTGMAAAAVVRIVRRRREKNDGGEKSVS